MVMSVVGVMFAPDQRRAAGELLRVCRPGGTIALASWTPESFVGEMFRLVTAVAPPPPGLAPPMRWGTEEGLRGLLGEGVRSVAHERCVYTFRHPSAESFADFFLSRFGPVERAAAALDEGGRAAFRADIAALARTRNRRGHDGPVAIPASYLQTVAQRA
jgi:SAM-dependent methyltransferase